MSIDNGSNESLEALLARSGLGIEDYEHLALTFHFRDAAQADLFLTTLASRSDAGEVRPAEVKAMAVRLLAGIHRVLQENLIRSMFDRLLLRNSLPVEDVIAQAFERIEEEPAEGRIGKDPSALLPTFRKALVEAVLRSPRSETSFRHDRAEAERHVDWDTGPLPKHSDTIEYEALYELARREDLAIPLTLGLVALVYRGAQREQVPDRAFWKHEFFWRYERPTYGRLFLLRHLDPIQTQPLLRRFCDPNRHQFGNFLYAHRAVPDVVIPHVVKLLETDVEEERSEILDGLKKHARRWEPRQQAFACFVRMAGSLLSQLGPAPITPGDRRPALWALVGVVPVIQWMADSIGRDPDNPCLRSLREIEAQLVGRWPEPPRSPHGVWNSAVHGWSPFTASFRVYSISHPAHPAQSIQHAADVLERGHQSSHRPPEYL